MNTAGPTSRKDWNFDPNAIGNLVVWNDTSTYTAAPGASWSNRAAVFSTGVNCPYVTSTSATATYINAATAGLTYGVFSFATTDNYRVAPDPILNNFSLVWVSKKVGVGTTGRGFQASATTGCNILYGYWNTGKSDLYINANPNFLPTGNADGNWDIYCLRVSEFSNIWWDRQGGFQAGPYTGYTAPAMAGLAFNGWGAFPAESAPLYFAEILLFDKCISIQDARAVEGYLAWKWGLQATLPTSHPFYSNAPYLRLFNPSIFPISPRSWIDPADGTTIAQRNGNTVQIMLNKGSVGNLISAATVVGDTFLPTINSDSLNGLSTLTFTQTQAMYVLPFASSSNTKTFFSVAKTNSNILTNWGALGQTWSLAPSEFFDNLVSQTGGGAACTGGFAVVSTTKVVSFSCGPSGVQVSVGANIGLAQTSFPSSQVWTLTSIIDAQNRGSNCNRIRYFSACNATSNAYQATYGQYYTSTTLSFNASPSPYRADPVPWFVAIPYNLNAAHHSGIVKAEDLFYDTALLGNDELKVIGYLSWKWGLTGNISSTYLSCKYIPPAIPSGFFGNRSNYFGTAQAITYLPLQSDLVDIGTWPQYIMSNGTGLNFATASGKTGLFGFSATSFVSFSNLRQAPFSLCVWFYNNLGPQGSNPILSYGISTISAATVDIGTNNICTFVVTATANTANQNYQSTFVNGVGAITWYCLGIAVSTATTVLYSNGTSVATLTGTYPLHSRADTIVLGRTTASATANSGGFRDGGLRHFALFDRFLTATEMTSFYNNTV